MVERSKCCAIIFYTERLFACFSRYSAGMFIRRTNTRNRTTGEAYFTHRLVDGIRVGKAVKQRTLLNLGARFDLPQAEWPALAARIDQLLHGQSSLLAEELSEVV